MYPLQRVLSRSYFSSLLSTAPPCQFYLTADDSAACKCVGELLNIGSSIEILDGVTALKPFAIFIPYNPDSSSFPIVNSHSQFLVEKRRLIASARTGYSQGDMPRDRSHVSLVAVRNDRQLADNGMPMVAGFESIIGQCFVHSCFAVREYLTFEYKWK